MISNINNLKFVMSFLKKDILTDSIYIPKDFFLHLYVKRRSKSQNTSSQVCIDQYYIVSLYKAVKATTIYMN